MHFWVEYYIHKWWHILGYYNLGHKIFLCVSFVIILLWLRCCSCISFLLRKFSAVYSYWKCSYCNSVIFIEYVCAECYSRAQWNGNDQNKQKEHLYLFLKNKDYINWLWKACFEKMLTLWNGQLEPGDTCITSYAYDFCSKNSKICIPISKNHSYWVESLCCAVVFFLNLLFLFHWNFYRLVNVSQFPAYSVYMYM